jgi:hypothetical protein
MLYYGLFYYGLVSKVRIAHSAAHRPAFSRTIILQRWRCLWDPGRNDKRFSTSTPISNKLSNRHRPGPRECTARFVLSEYLTRQDASSALLFVSTSAVGGDPAEQWGSASVDSSCRISHSDDIIDSSQEGAVVLLCISNWPRAQLCSAITDPPLLFRLWPNKVREFLRHWPC